MIKHHQRLKPMYKLHLLNLVLFVIVISLAFFIYFSEDENTQLQSLTAINPDNIKSIKIEHNKNTITINRQSNNQWVITQPVLLAANNFRINSILNLVNAPAHAKYNLSEIALNKIGLEDPKTVIQFDDISIAFGVINTATSLRYIKVNNTVYTIEDVYFPLISSSFSTLVSLSLLPENSTVEKLILLNQTINKNNEGLWQSNINTSADNIIKTIQHWQHNQAFGVHKYMQRETLGNVFIYLTNQQQAINYIITDTEPWLILARPELGLEYHLTIESYEQLISPTYNDTLKPAP